MARIELAPSAWKADVLPLNHTRNILRSIRNRTGTASTPWMYTTTILYSAIVGAPRIELEPHAPKACILPLYYAPYLPTIQQLILSDNFVRSAGNRTRVSRTRIVYTTAVLHSVTMHTIM